MAYKQLSIVLLSLVAIATPMAFAQSSVSLQASLLGNSVIDLNAPEKDRAVGSYAQFRNFDLNDGSFKMQIISADTNKVVSENVIGVYSTGSGTVDFNSYVMYIVTDEMLDEGQVATGNYKMIISTNDGSVSGSIPFTIIDNRN